MKCKILLSIFIVIDIALLIFLNSISQTAMPQFLESTVISDSDKTLPEVDCSKHINLSNYSQFKNFNGYTPVQEQSIKQIIDKIDDIKSNNYNIKNKDNKIYLNCSNEDMVYIKNYLSIYYGEFDNSEEIFKSCYGHSKNYCVSLDIDIIKELEYNKAIYENEINNILSQLDEGTENEKIAQIVMFLCEKEDYLDNNYNLNDTLFKHKANCLGYSITFKTMCERVGIPCDLISGYAGGGAHAWNRVHLKDGSVKYYDITWYDGTKNNKYLNNIASPHDVVGINTSIIY